jgi:hypothetical protein
MERPTVIFRSYAVPLTDAVLGEAGRSQPVLLPPMPLARAEAVLDWFECGRHGRCEIAAVGPDGVQIRVV